MCRIGLQLLLFNLNTVACKNYCTPLMLTFAPQIGGCRPVNIQVLKCATQQMSNRNSTAGNQICL